MKTMLILFAITGLLLMGCVTNKSIEEDQAGYSGRRESHISLLKRLGFGAVKTSPEIQARIDRDMEISRKV